MKKYEIEQINVSDNDYKLTGIYKKTAEAVKKGDIIFSYESSKSDFDVYAESDGYVFFSDKIAVGNILKVGDVVAFIGNEALGESEYKKLFVANAAPLSKRAGQTITKKAEKLMNENGVSENEFAAHEIVTEDIVVEYLKNKNKPASSRDIEFYYTDAPQRYFKHSRKKLAIIGAGKAALQVYDAVLAGSEHSVVFLYDNNPKLAGKALIDIPIRGAIDLAQIRSDYESGLFDEIIVSFSGDIASRKQTFTDIAGLNVPIANVIHPTCLVSNFVNMGVGNILFANVRIGPFVEIGDNNVISALCSLEHHNHLGSHNTFGPAVITSGSCKIADSNKFGSGIYVEPKINIGSGSIISSGVVLRQNIPSNSVVKNLSKIEIKPIL